MVDAPFGRWREPERSSLPLDLAIVLIPFVLLALLLPAISWVADLLLG